MENPPPLPDGPARGASFARAEGGNGCDAIPPIPIEVRRLELEEALAALRTRRCGLTTAEAARRLREFGANRIETSRRESLALRLAKPFTQFFAVILWVAAGLALLAEYRQPGQGMAVLALAIAGVVVVNGIFSFWQENRAERALSALERLLPTRATVLRDGELATLDASELAPGDVIFVEEGDRVPADARVIESLGLRVNDASITGESLPRARDACSSEAREVLGARNVILAGTFVVAGRGRALVFATGPRTEFGRIAHLTREARPPLSPLQKEIARLSRLVAAFSVVLGAIAFGAGRVIGLPFWDCFLFGIGIIVANVPEGLLPTVTLALAAASRRMAARNALVRHLPSVETLGSATVICTDKTGTLTLNRMTARAVVFAGGRFASEELARDGALAAKHRRFLEAAALCHNVKERGGERHELVGDPTEVAIVELALRGLRGRAPGFARVDELPFDSERRRVTTVHRAPEGALVCTKGALESVLPLCSGLDVGGASRPMTEADRTHFVQEQEALAREGLRVLAIAWRAAPANVERARVEEELVLAGLIGLLDPPRPEVPEAIEACRRAGVKVLMLTGDHPLTALAIAREVRLGADVEPPVVTGDELRRMSDARLQLALDASALVFARVRPEQKARIVSALQRTGEIVALTGDGVNDAPALGNADIGIAMGIAGTDVAREAADLVLLDDNFATIVAAIGEGRGVFENTRKFLTYILTSNVPELVPYVLFVLLRIPLALTVIQILAIDLGTDMLPALALGMEAPDPRVLSEPPRSRRERLLSWRLIARSYGWLGLWESLAAMAAFAFVLRSGGWRFGDGLATTDPLYRQGTTACLTAIVLMQIANVFLCRSDRDSAFALPRANPWILWGILLELAIVLVIAYTRPGNVLFGTAAVPASAWLVVVPFALAMVLSEESRKALLRRRARRPYAARPSVRRPRTRAGVP